MVSMAEYGTVLPVSKTNRAALGARISAPTDAARSARITDLAPTDAAFGVEVMQSFVGQPGFLLARVNQIYVALHNEVSKGETPAQAEFLLLLASSEKPDQISLARAAGVDTSTTTLVLDNLETRGLIARASDPDDRRRFILRLTSAGRRQVGSTRDAFLETQSRLVKPLSQASVAQLTQMLHQIGANPESPAPAWVPEERQVLAAAVPGNLVTGSPGFLCRRSLQVCEAYFIESTASLNLTPRQYSVLFIVNRHPGLSQAAFSRIFGLDPATCAVIMKNLAARGLLDRKVSSQDRRERLYSLTAAGRTALQAAKPLVDKSERMVLRGLTKAQVRELVAQVQAIVKAHSQRLAFPGVCFAG
jgi:DNA-binding MarR family transcriptional regulator